MQYRSHLFSGPIEEGDHVFVLCGKNAPFSYKEGDGFSGKVISSYEDTIRVETPRGEIFPVLNRQYDSSSSAIMYVLKKDAAVRKTEQEERKRFEFL